MINELGRFNFVFVAPCWLHTYVIRTMGIVRSDTMAICPSSHPVSPFITRHICPSVGRLFPRGRAWNKRLATCLICVPNIVPLAHHSNDFVSSGTWDPYALFSSAYHLSFSGWGDIWFSKIWNICDKYSFFAGTFPLWRGSRWWVLFLCYAPSALWSFGLVVGVPVTDSLVTQIP